MREAMNEDTNDGVKVNVKSKFVTFLYFSAVIVYKLSVHEKMVFALQQNVTT